MCLTNIPVSVTLGLDVLSLIEIWARAAGCAGEGVRVLGDRQEWGTIKNIVPAPTVSHSCIKPSYVMGPVLAQHSSAPSVNYDLTDDSYFRVNTYSKQQFLRHKQAQTLEGETRVNVVATLRSREAESDLSLRAQGYKKH